MLPHPVGDGNCFDHDAIYFYPHNSEIPQAVKIKAFNQEQRKELAKFKDRVEKTLSDWKNIFIPRLYYINDENQVIEIVEDADVQNLWKFFLDSPKKHKKVFYEEEYPFIFRQVKRHYPDAEQFLVESKGETSYLFKAMCNGSKVVIKISKGSDPERELEKIIILKHENIVPRRLVVNFKENYHGDHQFIKTYIGYSMPYYELGDMSKITTPLSEMSIILIALRIGAVLLHTTRKNHIHGDIKLKNLLIKGIEKRYGVVIYDLVIADWELSYSLDSVIFESTETKQSVVSRDIEMFSECLHELTQLSNNNSQSKIIYSDEFLELIQTMSSKPILSILELFTVMAFKINPELALSFTDSSLTENKKFMYELILMNTIAFKFAHENLKKDIEFVETILAIDLHLLKYVHEDLTSKPEFMEKYVRTDGLLLQYAAPSLKRDKKFVKIATDETACAIMYVTEVFDGYTDLLKECLKRNGHILEYALEKTKDIVLCAVSQDPITIQYAKQFENAPEIQQAAIDFYQKRSKKQPTSPLPQYFQIISHKHKRNDSNLSNTSSPTTPTLKKKQRPEDVNPSQ